MASETFSCPECSATLRYGTNLQPGAEVQCPKCNAQFPIPDQETLQAPRSRPTEEVTDTPGRRRPRFSEATDEGVSRTRRPAEFDRRADDYEEDEDNKDRPFTGNYSIDISRWFSLAGQHYSAILGSAIGFIFVAGLLTLIPYAIIFGLGQAVASQLGRNNPAAAFLAMQAITQLALFVLVPVFFFPLGNGFSAVCLAQLKGRQWSFGDFFSGFRHFSAFAGVGLAYQVFGLVVNIPTIILSFIAIQNQDVRLLLLAPAASLVGLLVLAFILVRVFMFTPSIIFDRKLGAMEAMKANWELTRGHFWGLFGVGLLLFLIYLGGALACGIGVLFALPYVMLILNAGYLLITDPRESGESNARYDD